MQDFSTTIRSNRIACIGAGYVGGPTMAVIASKCHDTEVWVVDINSDRIAAWNSDTLPIFEPGLDEIVRDRRGKNLFFSTDICAAISRCDIIFVSVNTPTKKIGVGAGRAADLKYWEACAREIAKCAQSSKIVVEKSTVPVRTAHALARVLQANERPGVRFCILSNPEFLAEGTAIRDLELPDRVLIGGPEDTDIGRFSIGLLSTIYKRWVPPDRVIATNLWSAELSKLVANAFLAQRISSINSISMLCEKTGADVRQVSHAIGTDSRIGSKFLTASIGFGGSCFRKDLLNLVYLCENFGLPEVAAYWQQVTDMNELQKRRMAEKVISCLFHTVNQKRVAMFGFAFKKDTGDTRDTAAVTVGRLLLEDGAILQVFDPKVRRQAALLEFEAAGVEVPADRLVFTETPEEAVTGAHAIVVMTEWDMFKTFDYGMFHRLMHKPAFVFDGRNILDHQSLAAQGFEVHGIGTAVTGKAKRSEGVTAVPSALSDV